VGQDQTGRGIKIAIVDSGIDQTNAMFSASGFTAPSTFPRTNAGTGGTFTNGKVIVAKNYYLPQLQHQRQLSFVHEQESPRLHRQ